MVISTRYARAVLPAALTLLMVAACSAASDDVESKRTSPGAGGSSAGSSGSTGNVGGVGAGISVDVAGSGGDGGVLDDACAASAYQGEQIPLDMHIMFDQSGSMDNSVGNGTRWSAIKAALVTFVQSPESADIGVGIAYFPLQVPCDPGNPDCDCPFGVCDPQQTTTDCNPNHYAQPDVPIALLPGVAPQIIDSLNRHGPGGRTPTRPALQGAMQYALSHQVANPGRKTIVVLATDGRPNDCNSSVGSVSQVAAAGLANNPPIPTFVIGIGNTGNLDQIAQAGGTSRALIVSDANASQQFLDAMNRIRGQALSCEFMIPTPSSNQSLNFNQVNVRFTAPGTSVGDVLFKVPNAAACDPTTGGWYYDDPANPRRILLCEATCDRVLQLQGRIDIELGCDTFVGPH